MTLEVLWHQLLRRGVELLLKGDRLEGGEPGVVDDGHALRLRRGQTCRDTAL